MRATRLIVADIDAFALVDDEWQSLLTLLEELEAAEALPEHLPSLLGLFERFPTDDSYGIFWGVLHRIEALPFSYEAELLASVRRMPGEFNTRMVNRIANTDQPSIAGVSIESIFQSALRHPDLHPEIRDQVEGFISFQASRHDPC